MSKRILICFPFAGAGASFFRPWGAALKTHFEVVPVQLPGREQRFAEQPFTGVEKAIDDLLPGLLPSVAGAVEVVVFGHSMGAVLAFEFARRLALRGDAPECRLVVSGSPSPTCPRLEEASGLDDASFIAQVERFAGYSHEALADPDLRELLLPVLRADVEMHESFRPQGVQPLPFQVTVVRSKEDALVTADESRAWQAVTSEPLEYVEVEGGHMYLAEDPSELIKVLMRPVRALA